jgi:hypothetical protein
MEGETAGMTDALLVRHAVSDEQVLRNGLDPDLVENPVGF